MKRKRRTPTMIRFNLRSNSARQQFPKTERPSDLYRLFAWPLWGKRSTLTVCSAQGSPRPPRRSPDTPGAPQTSQEPPIPPNLHVTGAP